MGYCATFSFCSYDVQPLLGPRAPLLGGDSHVATDQEMELLAKEFCAVLLEAVRVRVADLTANPTAAASNGPARVAILFSGGIDSLVLAALADRCLPMDEPIELINVAFGNEQTRFQTPDRNAAFRALNDLRYL